MAGGRGTGIQLVGFRYMRVPSVSGRAGGFARGCVGRG